ncbi:MAG: M1 family metallopeptidase [Fidelibacterota bacterium]
MKQIKKIIFLSFVAGIVFGQVEDKFKQLDQQIATPNMYRSAAGYPGHGYWQNRADYVIDVTLDDDKQRIDGFETITYTNNSPDELNYIWMQLDQNVRAKDSDTYKIATGTMRDKMNFSSMKAGSVLGDDDASPILNEFDGGFKIDKVMTKGGRKLKHTINKTMMRIDLSKPLKPGEQAEFSIRWWYNIQDRMFYGGRPGFEYFKDDDNYLYTICQWFPRLAMYNDVYGWQNKQFLGRGEFTLNFGDYEVNITVPADHVVAATGELQNAKAVLTKEQQNRFKRAKTSKEPVLIITQDEATINEKSRLKRTKTWRFKAQNVRDFAFTTSRKFIWDAMGVKMGKRTVMAMSYYPKEANPLYERFSTKAVAQTITTYSKYTFDYPYPVAISVEAANGMEYPMICFNYGRPEEDGTYSDRTKYGMISVIIHEVGHNYFPMIVNSDERQWTWMDEGLNTYLQFLTEQEWDRDYPSRRGPAKNITYYMKGNKNSISPIMTNSESIYQFGNNAYGKPATALNILRETIVGRELFDFAFKEYARSWMFKHPTPSDFFRILENASAVDLDWYWRGWFYGTDPVDISIDNVTWYTLNSKNPEVEFPLKKQLKEDLAIQTWQIQNKRDIKKTRVEEDKSANDFYNKYDPFEVTVLDKEDYKKYMKKLDMTNKEEAIYDAGLNYYEIKFSNIGGLVMPVLLEFTYDDGSKSDFSIPAEIWRMNRNEVTKVFATKKNVTAFTVDPRLETADIDIVNNHWPRKMIPSKFELFKRNQKARGQGSGGNKMQRAKKVKEALKEQENSDE